MDNYLRVALGLTFAGIVFGVISVAWHWVLAATFLCIFGIIVLAVARTVREG